MTIRHASDGETDQRLHAKDLGALLELHRGRGRDRVLCGAAGERDALQWRGVEEAAIARRNNAGGTIPGTRGGMVGV